MGSDNRIHYIDVLRGIGILFVVFAHINSQAVGGGIYFPFIWPCFILYPVRC